MKGQGGSEGEGNVAGNTQKWEHILDKRKQKFVRKLLIYNGLQNNSSSEFGNGKFYIRAVFLNSAKLI